MSDINNVIKKFPEKEALAAGSRGGRAIIKQ